MTPTGTRYRMLAPGRGDTDWIVIEIPVELVPALLADVHGVSECAVDLMATEPGQPNNVGLVINVVKVAEGER